MFQIYAGDSLVYEPGDLDLVLLTPKLTLEMGKAGSLEFTVPAGHPNIDILKQLTKPVAVDLDGERIFRGRVLSGSRTFYNQREIYCEGVLSYLVDSVQKAEKFDGKTHALFKKIITNHNARMPAEKQFTVGNITVEDQDIHLLGQSDDISKYDYSQIAINSIVDNWNTTYDYIETCLISYCGGYLMVRQENGVNYLDWVTDYTSTATQEIVFGENLLDLTDETTAEDIFTVLIPLGDDNLTVKTVNNNSDEIVDSAKVAKYGRIIKTNVFSNVTSAQTLLENGRRFLANNGDVPSTLTLTAVDLHNVYPDITAIHLGDRVYIRSDPHELSQYLTCTKIEYDLERPENTVYTFGREKQTLTKRYREDKRAQNDTYGNSANGGGGIGAAAADEAGGWHWLEDNVMEATDEKITDVEDEIKDKIVYKTGIDIDQAGNTVNIYSIATKTDTNEEAVARIVTWAGEDQYGNLGSRIALEADLVTVSNRLEAIEGVFSSITTDTAYASKGISSHTFYGSNYYISTSGDTETNLATHAHNIISSNGGLVLTGPIPLSSRVPFRIADTHEYQEAVSAVSLTGLAGTTYNADDGILSSTVPLKANTVYAGNMLFGCFTTTLSNGNTKIIRVGLNADKAYDDGKSDGISEGASSVSIQTTSKRSYTSGTDHSVSITDTKYLYGMLYGTIDATLTNGRTETIYVGMDPPTETRSATYTTNGLRTINVNSGKVGMTSVSINVNVPSSTPHYATFEVRAISPSGAYVYIYSDETGLMRLYEGDTFDQT